MEYSKSLPDLDYKLISRQILKELRGKKSQSWLSMKLGKSNNYISRLEGGLRNPDWLDFIEICLACKRDLSLFGESMHYQGDITNSEKLVGYLIGQTKGTLVAKILKTTPSKISRLKNGSTSPKFHEVLQLIQVFQGKLILVLNNFIDVKKITALNEYRKKHEKEMNLHFKHPESAALNIALNLSDYSGDPAKGNQFLADAINVPVNKIEALLKLLVEADVIKKQEKKYTYCPKNIVVSGSFRDNCEVRKYWLGRAESKLMDSINQNKKPKTSLFGYNLFLLNQSKYSKLYKEYIRSYENLVKAATYDDEVACQSSEEALFVMNMQIICLSKNEPNFSV